MKRFLSFLCAIILVMVSCGCTNSAKSYSGENADSVFNLAFWGVVNLNPTRAQSRADFNLLYLTQMQLVRFHRGNIECDACESFEKNESATVYQFHIRKDLKWEDGSELTANDFVYGAYCVLSPEMGSPKASSFYEIKNAEGFAKGEITEWESVGISALDKYTLQIVLEYGIQDYEKTIASKHLYPISKTQIDNIGVDALGSNLENTLCSGPYKMTKWTQGDIICLEKNKNYWDSENEFPVEKINLIQITDSNTSVNMFENNEVDAVLEISSDFYDEFNDYTYEATSGGIEYLWINENGKTDRTSAIMNNKDFRKALSYSINRNSVVEAVDPANKPYSRLVGPQFIDASGKQWIDSYKVNSVPLDGDINTAKAYMQKALKDLGYSNASDLPELLMVTFEDNSQKNECELIVDQWKKVLGINVKLESYDIGTAIGIFYQLDYDIFSIGWEMEVRPTDAMRSFMTGGTANAGIWSNAEFDELVNKSLKEGDPGKSDEYAWKAEQVFLDESAMIPLYVSYYRSIVKPYVTGYEIGFNDGLEFNDLHVKK